MRMKSCKRIACSILIAFLTVVAVFSGLASAATQREYVVSLIKEAGMREEMIGTEDDSDALAKSLGFFNNWVYEPTAIVNAQVQASMDVAMAEASTGLRNALSITPMEPYFVNGMAQPIFYYGNSHYNDTTGQGVVRYIVYVETNFDTDADGKLDLVKVLVQLPRAALEGAKFSTIYEARPYVEGTNGSVHVNPALQPIGNDWLAANGEYAHERLHRLAPPRVPSGITDTATLVREANYHDWYYTYTYDRNNFKATITYDTGSENVYEDLNWYDYYLVRGFAVVQSAGIGAVGGEGLGTYGADVEIDAFKCVIEWLTGDRKAYSDKVNNIEIKADWSNGIVGMTGRSYAATTPFGIITSGVKGLRTIVPVAGISSYYEYQNQQGVMNGGANYTAGMAWYVTSRLGAPDWANVLDRQAGYLMQMLRESTELNGDYGPHWARRDYTLENWFQDWGPSKIQTPMLIVHGANDNNVRPKQSILMNEAARKAGVDVRWIWHQGDHMTPTFPAATPTTTNPDRPYSMYCGDYTYDEWLNLWFSHYLYDLDNGILELLPGVLAQDNASGEWVSYDGWGSPEAIEASPNNIILDNSHRVPAPQVVTLSQTVYEEPQNYDADPLVPSSENETVDEGVIMPLSVRTTAAEGNVTVINSANGNSRWQNFLDAPTEGSSVYHLELTDNVTVKGVVKVNIRAAISSLGVSADNPLRVHVKLAEIAAPGTTLKYYGGNAMGNAPGVTHVKDGGSWQGGGVKSHNLVIFNQADTGTYREIAKGWMDLCNPSSGYDSPSSTSEKRIIARDNIGIYRDYDLYLQPAIHTATKGNKLALIITTGGTNSAGYTGNNAYTFSIDNDATNVVIPKAVPILAIGTHPVQSITVTEGGITGTLTVAASGTMGAAPVYQWYSSTTVSGEGGTAVSGATGASFTIPATLKAGTYYYYCEVSATGSESLRSTVTTVTVEEADIPEPPEEPGSGSGGCNAGYAALVIIMLVPFVIRKRS